LRESGGGSIAGGGIVMPADVRFDLGIALHSGHLFVFDRLGRLRLRREVELDPAALLEEAGLPIGLLAGDLARREAHEDGVEDALQVARVVRQLERDARAAPLRLERAVDELCPDGVARERGVPEDPRRGDVLALAHRPLEQRPPVERSPRPPRRVSGYARREPPLGRPRRPLTRLHHDLRFDQINIIMDNNDCNVNATHARPTDFGCEPSLLSSSWPGLSRPPTSLMDAE
jgi:hypothetical protein